MKRMMSLCLAFGVIIALAWFYLPHSMSQILLALNNKAAGLTAKSIETEFGKIHYLEGGVARAEADTVVLLHGIFARKEHWIDIMRFLTPHFHLIALDLPGFGDNYQLKNDHYRLNQQALNLHKILKQLDISSAHFGANSMGAQVAGILAKEQSGLMKSLAFIGSPLGAKGDTKSEMEIAIENGKLPLVVQTEKAFHERNAWLFPKTPAIPHPILTSWMHRELSTPDKNKQIWFAANNFHDTHNLLEIAPYLDMPTQIIWCKEDRIFHISGAQALHDALPDSRKEIMSGCGHVPMLDKPEQVADSYLNFLREI